MAESEQLEKRIETPEPDPIADRSMSGPLLVSSLLLIATLIWSLYDEVLGQRPWKSYQGDFVAKYTAHLQRTQRPQAEAEQEVRSSAEYQELEQTVRIAEEESGPRLKEINSDLSRIDQTLADITEKFQDMRAWIAAKTYELETTTSESAKSRIRSEIAERRRQQESVALTRPDGSTETKSTSFDELEAMFNGLGDEKARLVAEQGQLIRPANEARRKRDSYMQDNLVGLTSQQIGALLDRINAFNYEIRQIHVQEGDLVDRCESCHLGIREPIKLTAANMGGEAAFVSHPAQDLLKIHDPERFGCSTCHGGNGRGTTSVQRGHGRYKHWLWPLYYKENVQAGCNQCHYADRVTAGADVLNHGKELYQSRGCVGCHRYEGFDRETESLVTGRQMIRNLELDREARLREIRETTRAADEAESDEEARELIQRVDAIRQMISEIDARIDELDLQSKYLLKDQKKVGPNLKEMRAKLRKEWLPVWLADPQSFRPGTKMPTFRLNTEEVRAISAFLWQEALDVKLPQQERGDANRGKDLFKSIGCLACHSIDGRAIDMGSQRIGGDFAADLSRVGEKASFEYVMRWVHNPRKRLAPYSPTLKRDLTPEDYARKGLPFIFDDDHSKSPVDGHELQVQNMTVMPNFRLSVQDARDIATFLMSQGRQNVSYPDASYLDDPSLKEQGAKLVRTYGCAGCHEIKGFEDEQRIGTELTPEGSKPIERLDFALLTHEAKRGIDPITGEETRKWYDHKGFFENKLKSPGIYDRGRQRSFEEVLKMPNIYLEDGDVTALTTFLLGSVETGLPDSMRYTPVGGKKYVQDGWWVVQKYNCVGCHNILIGRDSVLMGLPMYQTPEGKEQLPPRLTSQGARVNPDWLMQFLKDPSLSPEQPPASLVTQASHVTSSLLAHAEGQPVANQQPNAWSPALETGEQSGANRNGVRPYLRARMPTFNFSPNELQALVNFFMGASFQQQPYIPERLEPLSPLEQGLGRALFTSNAAPCLRCHMTGDPTHDARATAPNFLIARERLKPGWTERWLIDPQLISPGTSMPSELFRRDEEHNRWVFNGPTPPEFATYERDHVSLLVRYMFQLDAAEQRRLGVGEASTAPAATPATVRQSGRNRREPRMGLASARAPSSP